MLSINLISNKRKSRKRIVSIILCLFLCLLHGIPAGAEPAGEQSVAGESEGTESGGRQSGVGTSEGTESAEMESEESEPDEPEGEQETAVKENLDFETDAALRLEESIASNEIDNWPTGPVVGAEGAILIEAETGTILYAKNIHEKLYPASTTKILTSLVAIENSSLDEIVEFSHNAVFSIETGSSNMGMDPGQAITMEQCLHGILIMSANEVCNAVAEHISGSIEAFVDKMNEKAAELGCLNSHFVTTNGLQDVEHYTTPYDLAQIARAFFANETLSKISGIRYEVMEPTDTQPDRIELYTHNELTKGTYECEGYIGGKTGYTSIAHQTLVTCAERGGMKLICVVMKEDSPMQFTDTVALFDYGFNNFKKCRAADYETNYAASQTDFFRSGNQVFGGDESIMSIDPDGYVILPSTIDFSEADAQVVFPDDETDSNILAAIAYSYEGVPIGSAKVKLADNNNDFYDFESPVLETQDSDTEPEKVIFVNIIKIVVIVAAVIFIFAFLIVLRSVTKDYHFMDRKGRNKKIKPLKMKNRGSRIRNGKSRFK